MKIEFRELKDDEARMLIEDVSHHFVNAIRRILLTEIPKLAIEDVTIYDNSSALFDEIIAHRLGMIPLPTNPDLLVFKDECTCRGEGCLNCTVNYTLSKEGPCTVYSKDLEAGDQIWKVKDGGISIVRLLKGQRLILEAEACLGKTSDHAKWQAAIGVGYRYYPEISIGDCDGCGECIDKCPKKILKLKKGKITITNEEDCILCNSCSDVCPRDAIEVKGNPRKFFFNFETDGSLTARETLLEALDIFHEKCEKFGERMKSL